MMSHTEERRATFVTLVLLDFLDPDPKTTDEDMTHTVVCVVLKV